jgi:ribosomal protein L40E
MMEYEEVNAPAGTPKDSKCKRCGALLLKGGGICRRCGLICPTEKS